MDESLYTAFAAVEQKHWWFVARRRIIEDQIRNVLRLAPGASILDVGCGTGGILASLSQEYLAYGIDSSPTAVRLCREAGLSNVAQGTLEQFPFAGKKFDVLLLLDVIEHIADDAAALRACRELLNPGGRILLTVPAYQFLWSAHDELNHHQRRYVRGVLQNRLRAAGYDVRRISYYNSVLFPAAMLQRLVSRFGSSSGADVLAVPPGPINRLLTMLFSVERIPLRHVNIPFGLSLLAEARPV